MGSPGSLERLRVGNRRAITAMLVSEGPMSRADLARGIGRRARPCRAWSPTRPASIRRYAQPDTAAVVRVVPGELGERAEVVGAVALAIARVAASS